MPIEFISIPSSLIVLVLSLFCLILLGVSISIYLKYRSLREIIPEGMPKDAIQKSFQMLYDSYKKAQTILGRAELDSVKVVADSKFHAKKLESEYQKILAEAGSSAEKNLSTELSSARDAYFKFINDLSLKTEGVSEANQAFIQQKTGEIFDKFEANLSTFLTSTQEKSTQAIELELKAARELIDTYKTEQLKVIDENIVAILERTLSLVITQKLSLKDHMDLIDEALEKAKVEKFIV